MYTRGDTWRNRMASTWQINDKIRTVYKVEELYDILLQQTTDESQKSYIFSWLGRIPEQQGKYEGAITIYEKVLEIREKTLPANHPRLATSYNNIGLVYNNMGQLEFFYYLLMQFDLGKGKFILIPHSRSLQ